MIQRRPSLTDRLLHAQVKPDVTNACFSALDMYSSPIGVDSKTGFGLAADGGVGLDRLSLSYVTKLDKGVHSKIYACQSTRTFKDGRRCPPSQTS